MGSRTSLNILQKPNNVCPPHGTQTTDHPPDSLIPILAKTAIPVPTYKINYFLGLFYNNAGTSRWYIALIGNIYWRMMDGKDLEGNSHSLIDVLSWCLPKGGYGKLLKFHSEKVLFWPSCSGSQIPPKSRSHLKIWGTKSVKWSKFHTQDPKISGAPTQNVATQAELSSWIHVWSITGNITDVSAFLT